MQISSDRLEKITCKIDMAIDWIRSRIWIFVLIDWKILSCAQISGDRLNKIMLNIDTDGLKKIQNIDICADRLENIILYIDI